MGKIVKFCTTCDEGFAEKFAFCPNCGSGLQAFEMNPWVAGTPAVVEPEAAASMETEMPVMAAPPETEGSIVEVEPVAVANATNDVAADEVVEEATFAGASEAHDESFDGTETVTSYNIPASTPVYVSRQTRDVDASAGPAVYTLPVSNEISDFRVTVMEEKDTKTRNSLLLATFAFMMVGLFSGLVYSIFSKDLEVGSIDSDFFNAILVEDVPAVVEEEAPKPREKKDAGGGGGGGREEKEETTRGDLADQTRNPIRPPDAKTPRMENPSLKLPPPSTEGDRKFEKKFDRWGDPNGRFESFSNGTGSGGGQGSGQGTGQGSGRGTGAGSGTGSGSGSGLGSGNGDGTGRGNAGGDLPPPPPKPPGVTQALKIVSKPKATYTDAARANNVQGVVILRVTFLASGAVGDISTVRGLPNGLTEQAIAAARRIQFEPSKVDGVGRSVTRQVEYSFTMY
jgi:TonB family protein